jgi:hypothetical protein
LDIVHLDDKMRRVDNVKMNGEIDCENGNCFIVASKGELALAMFNLRVFYNRVNYFDMRTVTLKAWS